MNDLWDSTQFFWVVTDVGVDPQDPEMSQMVKGPLTAREAAVLLAQLAAVKGCRGTSAVGKVSESRRMGGILLCCLGPSLLTRESAPSKHVGMI